MNASNSEMPNCPDAIQRSHHNHFFGGPGYYIAALISHQYHVFDPNATSPRHIHPRLNRNHHARLQQIGYASGDTGSLMNLQPNTVPGRMREVLGQTRAFQYRPGG